MLIVTTVPKSDSSGSDEKINTANPPSVVSADVKNARPVRRAAILLLASGRIRAFVPLRSARSSSTENSAQVATTSGPPTVDNGLSVMPEHADQHGRRADRDQHGDHRQQSSGEVAIAQHDERADEQQGDDRQLRRGWR